MTENVLTPVSVTQMRDLRLRVVILEMLTNELIGILLVERMSGMNVKPTIFEDLMNTIEKLREQHGLPSGSIEFYGLEIEAASKHGAAPQADPRSTPTKPI